MSTFDDVVSGLNVGMGLRGAFDKRQDAKAARKQQELLGGLRERSLGLGGETTAQQELAQQTLLSEDPVAAGQFFSSFKQLPRPEQEKRKLQNEAIGKSSAQILQLEDSQMSDGLLQTAQMFANNQQPELAAQATQLAELAKKNPADARLRLQSLSTQAQDMDSILKGGNSEQQKEYLKEERQIARTAVTNIKKRALDVNTAYDRINKLLDQGTRAANATTYQLIARLASPGIVTEKEAGALAGGAAGIAALATKFDDNGATDIGDLIRKSIDPNNPDLFDTKGMRQLAKALVSSEAPYLLQQFEDSKAQATTANISKQAFNGIFGDESTTSIASLRKLLPQEDDDALTPDEEAELAQREQATQPQPQQPKESSFFDNAKTTLGF
jgi:hypothetical protein